MVKKINNSYFQDFKEAVNISCGKQNDDKTIISDMTSASYDSNGEKICFYSSEYVSNFINMETIKLDDISKYRKHMLGLRDGSFFETLPAVDAICIDKNNEWFFIEFKNAKVDNKISSIKNKMLSSLWFCFYMLSNSDKGDGILNDDVLKFSREHVTYIIVGRREKNIEESEYIREAEACERHYQPHKLKQFVNYYFKDIYMLTELEFRNFILNFDKK